MKITVAVTCYNCENQIARALTEIDSILESVPEISLITVIDNLSTDNTLKLANGSLKAFKHPHKFRIFQNSKNIGLGGSHKVAFEMAQQNESSHLLIFHGDHQASALDIKSLIELSISKNSVTCLGARFLNLSLLSGYSLTRTAGNILLNFAYTFFCRQKIYDLGSGLNLFKLSDFNPDAMRNFDDGFTYNMDLLLYLVEHKIPFKYHPIRWSNSDQISNAHALKVGFKSLTKLLNWVARTNKK